MPPLTAAAFPQFFNSTRATVAKPVDFIINLSAKLNYVATNFLRGRSPFELVNGGTQIQETLHLADNGSFGPRTPGSFITIGARGAMAVLTANWRYYNSHVWWTDTEYDNNTRLGTDRERVKNFRTVKDQESYTSHLNGIDSLLFARPDDAKMETAPAGAAAELAATYSLPSIISEDTVRFLPPATSSDGLGNWGSTTTLFNQAPGTNTWHRNPVSLYDPADIFDEQNGILAAFDRIWPKLRYNVPADGGRFMQGSSPSDLIIFTNLDGFTKLQQIGRMAKRWTDAGDMSMPNPKFDGVDVVYAPDLDTAPLEQTRGASANYTGAAYSNPRFFIVNKRFTGPIWQDGNMLKALPAQRGGINLPDVTAVHTFSNVQLFCIDRRRNGIIAPTQ